MRKYLKEFIKNESGMELLQEAIIVVIAVGLIAAAVGLKDTINKKITDTSDFVDDTLVIPNNGGGDGGN